MPWGDHRGKPMDDVPSEYLFQLAQKRWLQSAWPGLHAYIRKHYDIIKQQAEGRYASDSDEEGYSSYEDYLRDVRN
jgi:hypothetical protein